jgi:hypothetical protein
MSEDTSSSLNPVDAGHADIHEYNIRSESLDFADRLLTIGSFTNHFNVGLLLQDESESSPYKCLIVDDKNADYDDPRDPSAFSRIESMEDGVAMKPVCVVEYGIVTVRTNPPPGLRPAARVPP